MNIEDILLCYHQPLRANKRLHIAELLTLEKIADTFGIEEVFYRRDYRKG
ncbi:MAG: hypothetical protein P8013_11780 [Candidatus Sulfobium sp.]|jgi:hypothetical protein